MLSKYCRFKESWNNKNKERNRNRIVVRDCVINRRKSDEKKRKS